VSYYFGKLKNTRNPGETIEILQKSDKSKPRIELTSRIWSKKSSYYYNKLENDVRNLKKISAFKRNLRNWIKTNVPMSEDSGDPDPGANQN